MICQPCRWEADQRTAVGNLYIDECLAGQKEYGHFCGHACCQGCDCQHRINTGGVLRND